MCLSRLESLMIWCIWTASSKFGTYLLCQQRRFRRACATAQSRQNLRCSLIQAVSQEEPSDRKPDPWPLRMVGHAQLNLSWWNARRHKLAWQGSFNFLSSFIFAWPVSWTSYEMTMISYDCLSWDFIALEAGVTIENITLSRMVLWHYVPVLLVSFGIWSNNFWHEVRPLNNIEVIW